MVVRRSLVKWTDEAKRQYAAAGDGLVLRWTDGSGLYPDGLQGPC
jgi:hypothetical protein